VSGAREGQLSVGGIRTRIVEAGQEGTSPLVLLTPGLFGTGTLGGLAAPTLRLWEPVLRALAAERRVIAMDTLGQGGTAAGDAEPSLDVALDHLAAVLDTLGARRLHLAGHDEGALLAIRLALRDPSRVASLTLVSAPSVAPTGDGLNPVVLANPLEPRLSVRGQRWVLERVSDSPHHVTDGLLAEMAELAAGDAAVASRARIAGSRLARTSSRAKGDTFADLRETGLAMPTAVIWGMNDPVAPPEHGRELLALIAQRQPLAQFHLLNRAGYFAYREQPRLFAALVNGFLNAVEE